MELIIDYDNIADTSKKEWLIHTLELLGIKYHTRELPQTLEEYNTDLELSNKEFEKGHFMTATDLKTEASKW